jgi:hypothetical protein
MQLGYFARHNSSCAHFGAAAVTVIAGPLDCLGVNAKLHNCHVQQPSR